MAGRKKTSIPEETMQNVCTRYTNGESVATIMKGTGLGMVIVRRILKDNCIAMRPVKKVAVDA